MRRRLAIPLVMAALLWGGCASVKVKAPEGLLRPEPPAATAIPRANPNDKADLLRENQQLRDRTDWLQDRAERSQKKYDSLAQQEQELRADIRKLGGEPVRGQEAGQ